MQSSVLVKMPTYTYKDTFVFSPAAAGLPVYRKNEVNPTAPAGATWELYVQPNRSAHRRLPWSPANK